MENNFLTTDTERSEALERKLSQKPAYRNIDQFIMLFNSGIFDKKNEEIKQIVNEIDEIYSNIVLQKGFFIVKSKNEDILQKTLFLLQKYELVAALKRIANTMQNEDYSIDTKLIFLSTKPGTVHVLTDNNDLVEYQGAEKLFQASKDFASNPFLIDLIKDYDDESGEDNAYLLMSDILNLDDSFIMQIGSILEQQ